MGFKRGLRGGQGMARENNAMRISEVFCPSDNPELSTRGPTSLWGYRNRGSHSVPVVENRGSLPLVRLVEDTVRGII